jgi:DNA-binding NarL/FixJ family response regulator
LIRVAILAASPVVRAGLEALVRNAGFDLTGDLTVADVVLASGRIDELDPQELPPVVLLSDGDAASRDLLAAGFASVLPEEASGAEIAGALQAASAGLLVLRREDFAAIPASRTSGSAHVDATLTARELEVLHMLADGLPNKLIAFQLGISEHTVKYHVTSILSRLNASSRAEAVAIGIRRGLILL